MKTNMELTRNAILFINLVYRVLLLAGIVSEDTAPNVLLNGRLLNWNPALTEKVVLICVNGLRRDFLDREATPHMRRIARERGSLSTAEVTGFQTKESGMRVLLSGRPSEASVFPWNKPKAFTTVLDQIPCKCVIGQVSLDSVPECYFPGEEEMGTFERLQSVILKSKAKECLFLVNVDFGQITEGDYDLRLRTLDQKLMKMSQAFEREPSNSRVTFVLTSSRGAYDWDRQDWSADVPVLLWGHAVNRFAPTKKKLNLQDVTVLVSTLLGRNFPPGCSGLVPVHLLNVTSDKKFGSILYNVHYMDKLMVQDRFDPEIRRSLKGYSEDEDTINMMVNLDSTAELLDTLHRNRMRLATAASVLSGLVWEFVLVVGIAHGGVSLVFRPFKVLFVALAAGGTCAFGLPAAFSIVLFLATSYLGLCNLSEVKKAFRKEGHRTFFFAGFTAIFYTLFVLAGNKASIVLLTIVVLAWPIYDGLAHRVNRKVLVVWLLSGAALAALSFYPAVGRKPTPSAVAVSSLFYVLQFKYIFSSFQRSLDVQSVVLMSSAVAATVHIMMVDRANENHFVVHVFSWALLHFPAVGAAFLRGTLLEQQMKFLLLLFIPVQLLSTRHESAFYLALSLHLFSWLFIENCRQELTAVAYHPGVFSIEKNSQTSTEKVTSRYYRYTFFFLVYCYVGFFAAGNVPNFYAYDVNILKPFTDADPFAASHVLAAVKMATPHLAIVYTFLVACNMRKKAPAPFMMLSIVYADVISSCTLVFVYLLSESFDLDISHYVILQLAIVAISVFYFLGKLLLRL